MTAHDVAKDILSGKAHAQSDMLFVKNPIVGDLLIADIRGSGHLQTTFTPGELLSVQTAIGQWIAEAINEKNARQPEAWTKISEKMPAKHARYHVRRKLDMGTSVETFVFFTATPCYGMHEPWWVPRVPSDKYATKAPEETDPVTMLPDDEWRPVV